MKRELLISAVTASVLFLGRTAVDAGECVDLEKDYAATLEKGPGSHEFDYAVYCLGANPIIMAHLWAGPHAAAAFAELRADTLKPRLVRVVSALLQTSWADSSNHRCLLYRIVARRGVSKLDSLDVFNGILLASGQAPYFDVYEEMAILQDCRAVDVLRGRYATLRSHPEHGYGEEILDVLSCLYHIPCAEAVTTARDLSAQEGDPKLRERLQRVVNRE